ncbi:MAG: hypothetical protein ACE5J2_00205 [Nitrososphaerales archaeon]
MDFNFTLLVMVPFWIAMVFINTKVVIEINKEWTKEKEHTETMKLLNDEREN